MEEDDRAAMGASAIQSPRLISVWKANIKRIFAHLVDGLPSVPELTALHRRTPRTTPSQQRRTGKLGKAIPKRDINCSPHVSCTTGLQNTFPPTHKRRSGRSPHSPSRAHHPRCLHNSTRNLAIAVGPSSAIRSAPRRI